MNILKKNCSKQFHSTLTKLCTEYSDIFALEAETITRNNNNKKYRRPQSHKEEIDKQVKNLMDDNIIESSFSEYNRPILLVPKKSLPGSDKERWRLVIYYRQINKKLISDKFPLPSLDDILDQLGRAKYFSCLDLMSGFHQIGLEKNFRDITSFSTNNDSYSFPRLAYGLKIAPNSFQRMKTIVLAA